ncbi:MAG: ABC transporter substrate-binding protein [Acidobacteria bacterium]|nr:ABC transporter substrate-binding protein [Acidobacteriota bacterium]NIM62169.1 ABC transporter substrate-binding protein [Acidobacteriota bacterium]NIO58963.1 ABC transporter substrate-binding protein [Acidobacteriota bacterium]NIQ30009.1 ABC transporter substrate-binding protein [Acidobacteriota bacterium]NIQ84775.1 ABC transporter substrate-binding protein [Acidobacteriota bacterium]
MKRLIPVLALALAAGCAAVEPTSESRDTPQRVVVFAPSAAEVLVALGLADRVVAVGSHGPWPEALAELESAGSFDRPDLERIVELESDLVLNTASVAAAGGHERLERLGVAVESLDTSTFAGVFSSLQRLGVVFDRESRAEEIATEIRHGLEQVRAATESLPRRSVLFVVGRDPLYVAGPGSHVDELIRLGAGTNVAHDATAPYQQFSVEAVLERRPEVIVDTSGDAEYWARWPFLPAVRDGSVYRVEPDVLVIPGIRLPEMAHAMTELIHPGTFPQTTDQ